MGVLRINLFPYLVTKKNRGIYLVQNKIISVSQGEQSVSSSIAFLAELFQQLCSLNGGEIFDEISQILSSFGIISEIWTNAGLWLADLVGHMTLEWDLSDLEMMWSFPPPFPIVSLRHDARDHVETTSGRPKSVTGKFRMTFSLEILTFSLKPVKFNPGTAGKLT